jgi:predicted HAD superfamily Cof-like phosphohydrolase
MSQTNFEKVVEFNKIFGVPISKEPQLNIFDKNPKLTKLRFDLIKEEVDELSDAIKDKDFPEVVDALGDILYVVYGAGSSFGVDMDKVLDKIHKSNMSKLCDTEEIAIKTIERYQDLYVNNKSKYDSPVYRKDEKTNKYIVYNKSTGKILKSINYNPVDFTNYLK